MSVTFFSYFLGLVLFLGTTKRLLQTRINSQRIYGNSSFLRYYYMDIYVGTPPQKQSLLIDTGSYFTGFPCQQTCSNCGNHINPKYDLNASSSSSLLSCLSDESSICSDIGKNEHYLWTYAEGSTYEGKYFTDLVSVSNSIFFNFTMGCHIKETGLFFSQEANGILGLALTHSGKFSLISELFENKIIDEYMMSFCIANDGGYILMGGINDSLNLDQSNTLINPIILKGQFYINLKSINVGSEPEIQVNKDFLLDTGTTITYFREEIFDSFLKKFTEQTESIGLKINQEDLKCLYFNTSRTFQEQIKLLPSIYLKFENSTFEWKPENYLLPEYNPGNHFCLGIDKGKSNVLGSTFFHNIQASFDIENKQIIISPANCSTEKVNSNEKSNISSSTYRQVNESNSVDIEATNIRTIKYFMFILIILISMLIIILSILLVLYIRKFKSPSQNNLVNNPENRSSYPSLNLNPQGNFDINLKQEEIKLDIIDSNR